MNIKLKWCLLLFLVVVMSLTGCGENKTDNTGKTENKPEKSGENTDNGTITIRVWAEENNFEMLNVMAESFKDKYKNEASFDIILEVQSDASTRDIVLADAANAADVFHVPDDQISSMAGGGSLEPVHNLDAVRAENVAEACDAATVNGTLYAYPMTADNGYFLYYNKKYFTDEDIKTMDGVLAAANKANKKISMDLTSGWYMYSFFGNTGLEFGINDDNVTNYCNWNTTEGEIKGLDVVKGIKKILDNPAFVCCPDSEFLEAVKDGSVIAGVSGVWNAIEMKEAWGDDCGAVKLPTYTCADKQIQMASFTGYKTIGVNYYSKNKEWAVKFAEWITNEENQMLRFSMRNQGPSNIKAASSDEVSKIPAIQAVIEQSQYGKLQRVGNNYWAPFEPFVNRLMSGKLSDEELQETLDTLVEGITASIAN